MVNRCLYCNLILAHEGFSVCESCGKKIWGKKMYNLIKENMKPEVFEEEIQG